MSELLKAPHQAVSLLVHGYSKVGKSLLGASTPPPRVIFDVESAARFLPIAAVEWDPAGPPPKVDGSWDTAIVPVRTWSDATTALEWLVTGQHPFRSATVDSISELQWRALEHQAGNNQLKLQDWGAVLRLMGQFVRALRDMTMHPTNPLDAVVMTSMSKLGNDGWLRPYLQGQMQAVIPYIPDICAYLYVDTDNSGVETRRLLTRRRDNIEAGERVQGKVPPLMNLPVVTGATLEEIRKKNVTVMAIRKRIFSDTSLIAQAKIINPADAPSVKAKVAGPAASEEGEPEPKSTTPTIGDTATEVVAEPTTDGDEPTDDQTAINNILATAAAVAHAGEN